MTSYSNHDPIHSNHGLPRTVSEINGDFSRKSQIFPTPMYLTTPLREFPLEFCNGGGAQKKTSVMPVPDGEKSSRMSTFV